jgi:hypothetical protein
MLFMKLRHSTQSPYFTWNYVTVLCRHTLHKITSQYSVAILFMKLRHSTLSLCFSWNYVTVHCRHTLREITSQYSVAMLFMKLRHSTLSPYFSWNYVTVLCRHTLSEITPRYSVAILCIKLRHSTLSPYFTWNYPASRFEQLTPLLRILGVPLSYFGPITGCPAECLLIFLSLSMCYPNENATRCFHILYKSLFDCHSTITLSGMCGALSSHPCTPSWLSN